MRTRVPHWRVIKWIGVAAAAVMFVIFARTLFDPAVLQWRSGSYFGFGGGGIIAGKSPRGFTSGGAAIERWFVYSRTGTHWWVLVPGWFLILVVLIPTTLVWLLDARVRRRKRLNQCVRCGYDRAGLVGGAEGAACPECGGKA